MKVRCEHCGCDMDTSLGQDSCGECGRPLPSLEPSGSVFEVGNSTNLAEGIGGINSDIPVFASTDALTVIDVATLTNSMEEIRGIKVDFPVCASEDVLPVIRLGTCPGMTVLDTVETVIAVYRERLVLFRKRRSDRIPPEAYEPDGARVLRQAIKISPYADLGPEDIERVEVAPRIEYGGGFSVKEEGREIRIRSQGCESSFYLPEEDVSHLVSAFRWLFATARVANRLQTTRERVLNRDSRPLDPATKPLINDQPSRVRWAIKITTWIVVAALMMSLVVPAIIPKRPMPNIDFSHAWDLHAEWEQLSKGESNVSGRPESHEFVPPATDWSPVRQWEDRWGWVDGSSEICAWISGIGIGVLVIGLPALLLRARFGRSAFREHRRKSRAANTTRGKSRARPWQSPILGNAMKTAGVVLWLAGFAASIAWADLVASKHNIVMTVWGNDFLFLAYVPATCLIYYGYRLGMQTAVHARKADNRPPILYLHPFEADGRHDFSPSGLLPRLLGLRPAWSRFSLLSASYPLRLLRLLTGRATDTAEEQLAIAMRRYGPVVAVGCPGETLPTGGAARMYLTEHTWQVEVENLLEEAVMVVLTPGQSPGVWWETEAILRHAAFGKVLLNLVTFDGWQSRYEAFRLRFEALTGHKLPRCLGTNLFLDFAADGSVRALIPRTRSPFVWPLFGCAVDLRRTLSPFIAKVTGRPISKPHDFTTPGGPSKLAAVLAILAWTVLVTIPYFVFGFTYARIRDAQILSAAIHAPGVGEHRTWRGKAVPYRLELPATWRLVESATTEYRSWTIGNTGASLMVVALRPKIRITSVEVEKAEARGTEGDTHNPVQLLDRHPIYRDGREWLESDYRGRVRVGLKGNSFQKLVQRLLFGEGIEVLLRSRVYASNDAVIVIRCSLPRKYASLTPALMESVFNGFSLPKTVPSSNPRPRQ